MILLVRNLITENKYDLISPFTNLKNSFTKLGKNYVIKQVQAKLTALDNGEKIDTQLIKFSDTILKAGLDKYNESIQQSLNKPDYDRIFALIKNESNSAIEKSEEFVKSLFVFLTRAYKDRKSFASLVLNHIIHKYETITSLDAESLTLMVKKLMSGMEFNRLIEKEEESLDVAYEVGRLMINYYSPQMKKNSPLTRTIVNNMLKLFIKTRRIESIKKGKKLFVSYFIDFENYPEPTPAYKTFIEKKYKTGSVFFRLTNMNNEMQRMMRLRMIDVVHTSIYMDEELLSLEHIFMLFANFDRYSADFEQSEQIFFVSLRNLIIKSDENLTHLPSLYDSLYDLIAHASQYYTYGRTQNLISYKKTVQLFDDYLDFIWKKKRGISTGSQWKWVPDQIPQSLEENYVFYKLCNIVSNHEYFNDVDVQFANFQYQNNYLIHKFTTLGKTRGFVNFVRNRLFPGEGFNYKFLTGAKIPSDVMKLYSKYYATQNQEL